MGGRRFAANWNSPEWALADKACVVDDSSLIDEAISMTAVENLDELYKHVRRFAHKHDAIAILKNLIESGVHITHTSPADTVLASKETLELLLTQGWDINALRYPNADGVPFM